MCETGFFVPATRLRVPLSRLQRQAALPGSVSTGPGMGVGSFRGALHGNQLAWPGDSAGNADHC